MPIYARCIASWVLRHAWRRLESHETTSSWEMIIASLSWCFYSWHRVTPEHSLGRTMLPAPRNRERNRDPPDVSPRSKEVRLAFGRGSVWQLFTGKATRWLGTVEISSLA